MRTRVGYGGGKTQNPNYRAIGDHSETLQIDFDPHRVSYETLLDVFWDSHDPTRRSWSRQYRNVLFYHNDDQKRLAIKTRDRLAEKVGQKVFTEILPADIFFAAEPYHQKHALRGYRDLMAIFRTLYENDVDFMNSTAAARLNGFVGGYGTLASLENDLSRLKLPSAAVREMLGILQGYGRKI